MTLSDSDSHTTTTACRLHSIGRPLRALPVRAGRRQALALLVALAALAALAAGAAYAYFAATVASGGNGAARSGSMPSGGTPEASASGTSVTVSWGQSTLGGQRLGVYSGGGYAIERYPASGGSGVTPAAGCDTTIAGSAATLSCTESSVPPGTWKYTVTPVLNRWTGAESAKSATVTVIGPPASIAVQSGSPQSATVNTAYASALVVVVTDSAGQPVPGATVTFSAPSSGASGTFSNATRTTTATTAANGQATASAFTANTIAGPFAVSAGVSGVSASASFSLTNVAGSPTQIAFTPATPGPGVAGEAIQNVAVSVKDSFGNVVGAQETGSISLSIKSGPQASFNSGTTIVNVAKGLASFTSLVLDTAGSYAFTATPSSIAGVSSAVNSNAFSVGAAAASKVVFTTEPSTAVVRNTGFGTQPVVTVQDLFGNRVTTDSSSVALTLNNPEKVNGASLTCTVNPLAASAGVAAFGGCKINKDGNFTLHAADGALTPADSTSIAVTG